MNEDIDINEVIKQYSLNDEEFENYYNNTYNILIAGKRKSENRTLIIIGGQPGAGKTRLIPVARMELRNNVVLVDFDELKAFHPNYLEVCSKYNEDAHRILHADVNKVKNKILDRLIENSYNVIYEGALRDTEGFIEFASKFKDRGYAIKLDVLAVPKLESYSSEILRYALSLLVNETPRWVNQDAHDAAYDGVPRTVREFINRGITNNIDVFVRNIDTPRLFYSSKENIQNPIAAISVIEHARNQGRRDAVNNFGLKYKVIRSIFEEKCPDMLDKLSDLEALYESEKRELEEEHNK